MANVVGPEESRRRHSNINQHDLHNNHNYGEIVNEECCPIIQDYKAGSTILVVLFGWAGCRERYLSKYHKMYEHTNVSTVRFTVPISKVRSFASYRAYALEVYEKVFDKDLPYDVYFHLFSMNGCSLFTAVWDLFDTLPNEKSLKHRVRGVIFDSSPANVTPMQSARAISFATLPPSSFNSAVRESYRALLLTFFSFQRAMIWMRSHWDSDVYEKNFAFFRLMAMKDLPDRQLYVYSSADEICSDFSIEQFSKAQKEMGKQTELIHLPDSPHCQHLRVHPETYTQKCAEFIGHRDEQEEVTEAA